MKLIGKINDVYAYKLNHFNQFLELPEGTYGIFNNEVYNRSGEVLGYVREDNVINWYKKKEEENNKQNFSEWDNLMKEIDEMRKMVDNNKWDYVVL